MLFPNKFKLGQVKKGNNKNEECLNPSFKSYGKLIESYYLTKAKQFNHEINIFCISTRSVVIAQTYIWKEITSLTTRSVVIPRKGNKQKR